MPTTGDVAVRRTNESVSRTPRRPGHPPRPLVVDLLATLAGGGLGVTLALVLTEESRTSLAAPGGAFSAGGRLAGFVGTYLILVMVVLIARLPWLERTVGQDRLVRWHRRIAPWALGLIVLHVLFITLGYAQAAKVGFFHQLWTFVTAYPSMLGAVVGFGLLVAVAVFSVRMARRRLKYETWWTLHLYTYLALALAFGHQIANGVAFIGHPLTRAYWIAIWLATAGTVLLFRVLLPVARSLRHQLKVVSVRREAPGVTSIVCRGRRVERLAVSGGQFFQWRFLARGLFWHSHPFSLSALPQPPYLRLTVKGIGDHSQALTKLKPGTRVFVEGPYGTFTHQARSGESVALIGAGVGLTPLRALLEDLPPWVDVAVIARGSTEADLVHRRELVDLVQQRGGTFHQLVGTRQRVQIGPRSLHSLVPDIAHRDVYVCGPEGFNDRVIKAALRLGTARHRIHREVFSF